MDYGQRPVPSSGTLIYAETQSAFEIIEDEMYRKCGEPVVTCLNNIPFEKWTKAWIPGLRFGYIASGAVESHNSIPKEERSLSTLPLCQIIFEHTMVQRVERQRESKRIKETNDNVPS